MITITCAAVAATALLGVASAGPADGFTECMRAHGLPGFPDATVTADGRLLLESATGAIDPFEAGYRAALAACANELPADIDPPTEPQPPTPPEVPAPVAPRPPAPPEVPAP
jgi:hypothetical protein